MSRSLCFNAVAFVHIVTMFDERLGCGFHPLSISNIVCEFTKFRIPKQIKAANRNNFGFVDDYPKAQTYEESFFPFLFSAFLFG